MFHEDKTLSSSLSIEIMEQEKQKHHPQHCPAWITTALSSFLPKNIEQTQEKKNIIGKEALTYYYHN